MLLDDSKPEIETREVIDQNLILASRIVRDKKRLKLFESLGVGSIDTTTAIEISDGVLDREEDWFVGPTELTYRDGILRISDLRSVECTPKGLQLIDGKNTSGRSYTGMNV